VEGHSFVCLSSVQRAVALKALSDHRRRTDNQKFSPVAAPSIFSISNSSDLFFASTAPGTGNIGFKIGVSPGELADLQTNVFGLANSQDLRVGLSSEFTLASGGQEDFSALLGANAQAVPGPVVGAGLPGFLAAAGALIAFSRRDRSASLSNRM